MGWHLLVWIPLALLGLFWSLLCWAAKGLVNWEGWRKGVEATQDVPLFEFPEWLKQLLGLNWIEEIQAALVSFWPQLHEWLLSWPDLGAWFTVALWLLWAVGMLVLLGVGGLLSLLIALGRRAQPARRTLGASA